MIFDAIGESETVADVGCGDGDLSLLLAQRGKKVIAVEYGDGPFARLKTRLASYDRIEIRQGDGLTPIGFAEVDTAVIAGMGGQTILGILERGGYEKALKKLVISPHTDWMEVRLAIMQRGWHLTWEDMVYDRSHFYVVMVWQKGDAPCQDWPYARVGPLLWRQRHRMLPLYLRNRLHLLEKQPRDTALSEILLIQGVLRSW